MSAINIYTIKLPERADRNRLHIITIVEYALDQEYIISKVDSVNGLIRLSRPGADINLHSTTMTVTTEIMHPRKGKSQLHRKGLSLEMIKKVIQNPRLHTGQGYYLKQK